MNCHKWLLRGLLVTIGFAIISCKNGEKPADKRDVLVSALDTAVHPGDDFFHYAHVSWIKANPIPSSESSYGINLEVQNEVYRRLLGICAGAAAPPGTEGTRVQQIGDLWASGMDSMLIEKQRAEYLTPY